jgi:hypothetical protein
MASLYFRNYERTMRRIYWLEFVDELLEAAHLEQFRTPPEQSAVENGDRSIALRQRRPDRQR